jgi:hypothetical protein
MWKLVFHCKTSAQINGVLEEGKGKGKGKREFVPVFSQVPRREDVLERGGIASCVLWPRL